MQDLVDAVNDQDLCRDLRLALIAYIDHQPQVSITVKHHHNFSGLLGQRTPHSVLKDPTYVTRVWPFTSDVRSVKKAIGSLSAQGKL